MTESLSVVGLGKLGLCLAACFAEKGFETIGVDIDRRVVDAVNKGSAPIQETGMEGLIARHGGTRLRATISHRDAIEQSDITFVLVATPSRPDGTFSNHHIEDALSALATAFRESRKPRHVFVISSTVIPGSTEGDFIPLLEKASGRRLHSDFDVCFDPDFVALGSVVRDFLNPDMVVIGETSADAGRRIEMIHRAMCENDPPVFHMSITNAEITKVSLNAFITMKISFANSLANLCERIPGADVDAITQALGADKRISPHYFRGGLGFGGTCFPRDTKAFISIAGRYGSPADLIRATACVNDYQDAHLSDVVQSEADKTNEGRIGILGLSFTHNTPVITESPSVKLIKVLLDRKRRVVVFDPLAMENAREVFGDAVEYARSAHECLKRSDVCVVTTRLKDYKAALETFRPEKALTLIDCWRMVDPERLDQKIKYIALGRSNTETKGVSAKKVRSKPSKS